MTTYRKCVNIPIILTRLIVHHWVILGIRLGYWYRGGGSGGSGIVVLAAAAMDNNNDDSEQDPYYKTVVYVSSQDGIDVYDFDEASSSPGAITHIQSYYPQLEGGADPLAVHDKRKLLLYASFRQQQEIHTLDIDPSDGRLTFLDAAPDFNNSVHIALDDNNNNKGDFLLAAYYGAGAVAVQKLGSGGGLSKGKDGSESEARVTKTAQCAHMIQQVSGGLVLVPHTCDNRIWVFRLGGGGSLKQVNLVDGGMGTVGFFFSRPRGPRHLVEHPITKGWIYVANEMDSSVTFYILDKMSGDMTEVYSWSTLPQDFTFWIQDTILRSNTVAAIHMTPDGRFLYVSNRGHNSIAAFAVDQTNGRLQNVGIFRTERTPRGFQISPSGQFLLVAGQDSGRLSTYRIGTDGRLSWIGRTKDVGRKPVWVEFVKL